MQFWKLFPAFLGIAVPTMMQVGPDDAILNFCKWPRKLLPDLAENCLPGISATHLYATAAALILTGLVWFAWPYFRKRAGRQGEPAVPSGGMPSKLTPRDLQEWRARPEYRIWDAAYLMHDLEPQIWKERQTRATQKVLHDYHLLQDDFVNKRFKSTRSVMSPEGDKVEANYVSRDDLIDWAAKNMKRIPKFLQNEPAKNSGGIVMQNVSGGKMIGNRAWDNPGVNIGVYDSENVTLEDNEAFNTKQRKPRKPEPT